MRTVRFLAAWMAWLVLIGMACSGSVGTPTQGAGVSASTVTPAPTLGPAVEPTPVPTPVPTVRRGDYSYSELRAFWRALPVIGSPDEVHSMALRLGRRHIAFGVDCEGSLARVGAVLDEILAPSGVPVDVIVLEVMARPWPLKVGPLCAAEADGPDLGVVQ